MTERIIRHQTSRLCQIRTRGAKTVQAKFHICDLRQIFTLRTKSKFSHIDFVIVKPFVKDKMTNPTDLKMPAISQIKNLNVVSKDLFQSFVLNTQYIERNTSRNRSDFIPEGQWFQIILSYILFKYTTFQTYVQVLGSWSTQTILRLSICLRWNAAKYNRTTTKWNQEYSSIYW